jgi:hypothetical protein
MAQDSRRGRGYLDKRFDLENSITHFPVKEISRNSSLKKDMSLTASYLPLSKANVGVWLVEREAVDTICMLE